MDLYQAVRNVPDEPRPAGRVPHPGSGAVKSITVLLVEDLDLVRGALVSLLSGEMDIHVVQAVRSTDQVVAVAERLRPDVVVADADRMAGALTTISELRLRLPTCQLVVLTSTRPAGLIRRLLAAGVLGVIGRSAPAARLLEAIRGTARGKPVVDVDLAMAALGELPNPLTGREREVLRLAAGGAAGPEIARRLHLSRGTVRNHLSRAINKTGVRTTADAIRIAAEAGWL